MAFLKFVSFCIQTCLNFVLWVSFLAGVGTGNRMPNFISFCYWKGVKFMEKIYLFWAILACVIHALSESESFVCWGQGRKRTCTYFLCKVLRRKDSLPFPREKIDSGVLWHNFGIFAHTEVRVFFLFIYLFFFLNSKLQE